MKKEVQQQKISLKDKVYVYIFLTVIVLFFLFLFKYFADSRESEIKLIKSNPVVIKAVVVSFSRHKGNSLSVRYFVDGTKYVESDWHHNAKNVKVGDSIYIKYYKIKPELMITECNIEY